MRVFFTVDTEFWPRSSRAADLARLEADIQRDIYGVTRDGEFGLRYQLDALDAAGLKGVFFIEAISALRVGIEPLRQMIHLVQSRGHSAELHIHSEWLDVLEQPLLEPGRRATYMSQLNESEQSILIAKGLELFKAAGSLAPVRAFRAGNYGANHDTLRALAHHGIAFDSSYNYPFVGGACGITTPSPLLQPRQLSGVMEVPVAFNEDFPGHYRHAQLMAMSAGEMQRSLESAHARGWSSFVIVSHSCELIQRNEESRKEPRADYVMIKRFESLLRYLSQNKDRYQVGGFQDISPKDLDPTPGFPRGEPLRGSWLQTSLRWAEQGYRRLAYR